MFNFWLYFKDVRNVFPIGSQTTIAWVGHELDGYYATVSDYYLTNKYVNVEVVVLTPLHGLTVVAIPPFCLRPR